MHDIFNAAPDIQILGHLGVWDIFLILYIQ